MESQSFYASSTKVFPLGEGRRFGGVPLVTQWRLKANQSRLKSLVGQLRRQCLHLRAVRVQRTNQTRTQVRIGLVEVRQHRVLVVFICNMAQVAGKRGDEIALALLSKTFEILARLPEILLLMD